MYIPKSFFTGDTLKSCAISRSSLSADENAVNVLLQIIGRTISIDVIAATVPFENQTKRRTINDATGVDLIMPAISSAVGGSLPEDSFYYIGK